MEKLSVKEKVGYGIGEIASNIIWMTIMFFLAIFYTDTFGIPASVVGTMFFVVRIFDAINDPIMGTISDRTKTRWGKYRPFILWMAIPYGLGGVLMFITPDFNLSWKIVYAYSTYILMMVIYTAIMIPFSALSGVMTSDYLDRTSLNSYRFIGAFIGGLFIQGLALYMVDKMGNDNESIIQASIQEKQIVIEEKGVGTTKVTVIATDEQGESIEDDFTFKVNLQGENPPTVINPLTDTNVTEGFSKLTLDISNLFQDIDNDDLDLKVESSAKKTAEAVLVDDSSIEIIENGVGNSFITITANDGKGGMVSNNFLLRIAKKGNQAPLLVSKKEDLTFQQNFIKKKVDLKKVFGIFPKTEMDISGLFKDPDGDEIFLTATSSHPDIVSATLIGSNLILRKKSPGDATISVTADDNKGGLASTDFGVSINTTGNTAPIVKSELDDIIIQTGFNSKAIDLNEFFSDKESNNLTYSFKVNNSAKGYQYTMAIFAVLCVFLFLVTFFSTKERVQPISEKSSSLKEDLGDLMKNRPWVILFIVSLITLIYVGMRSAVIAYYFRYYVGDSGLTAAYLVIGSITIILVLGLTKWLTKIFDKRLLYVICMIGVGASILGYVVLSPENILMIFILQIAQSLFSAPTMPLLWSMLADSADYNEWKTGRKAMGLAYSASTFAQKAGIAFGGALALWILSFYGYQANVTQSAQSLFGMKMMMSVYPAVGAFICAVIIWFYNLDAKKMQEIDADLKVRREQASNNG